MPVILREPIRGLPWQSNPTNTPAPEAAPTTSTRDGRRRPARAHRRRAVPSRRPPASGRSCPNDRKEAAKQARAKQAEARDRARVGMAAGDDRYLPTRDRGPQKKYVRDYVDARFSIGEVLIPVMFLVILLTLIPDAQVQTIGILALWAFFIDRRARRRHPRLPR